MCFLSAVMVAWPQTPLNLNRGFTKIPMKKSTISTESTAAIVKSEITAIADKYVRADMLNLFHELINLTEPAGDLVPYMRRRVNYHLLQLVQIVDVGARKPPIRDYDFYMVSIENRNHEGISRITNDKAKEILSAIVDDISTCTHGWQIDQAQFKSMRAHIALHEVVSHIIAEEARVVKEARIIREANLAAIKEKARIDEQNHAIAEERRIEDEERIAIIAEEVKMAKLADSLRIANEAAEEVKTSFDRLMMMSAYEYHIKSDADIIIDYEMYGVLQTQVRGVLGDKNKAEIKLIAEKMPVHVLVAAYRSSIVQSSPDPAILALRFVPRTVEVKTAIFEIIRSMKLRIMAPDNLVAAFTDAYFKMNC